jgi:pantetheine-phosphate adenylyltransferase
MRLLFAGTFDPPSLGHLDLIERGIKLCDELYVGIANNPAKKPLFTVDERKKMLQALTKAKVVVFSGLVVDFAKKNKITCLLRGLRSFADLDRELQMAQMNRELTGIETLILPADPRYAHISSSLIRELASNKARLSRLVPASIEKKIYQ